MRGFLLAFWLFCIAFVGGERSALAFGAVAFDGASGAFGFSYDARSQSEADRMALARCSGNCAIRARFNRTCLAVSGDINNSYRPYGYGLNNDIVAAQNRAKRECQNRGGDFCVIRARACDQVGPSNPNGTGGNNGSQNGTISYGEDYIRVTSNGVRWLRNYWNDFARCTAWCGKTRDNARNDCAARNQTASIIKCDCNETRRPYFSDVAYTCEAANKVVCKSGPTRTEAARRTETFIFNDNARCSAWCPRAIEGAKQICSSRGGVGAAIHGCNCNETRRPFHARVSFSCSFNSAANCTSQNGAGANANSSLMVLIDVSGSMGQGSKLANAKKAAIAGIKRAMAQGTEVSVAAFSGECNGPLTRHVPFGASEQQLVRFVQGAAGGRRHGAELGSGLGQSPCQADPCKEFQRPDDHVAGRWRE